MVARILRAVGRLLWEWRSWIPFAIAAIRVRIFDRPEMTQSGDARLEDSADSLRNDILSAVMPPKETQLLQSPMAFRTTSS
jgi:hypothetical protein